MESRLVGTTENGSYRVRNGDVIHDVNFPRESFPDYHNVDRIAIVQAFTDALKHTNPNFRAGTFVEACGVDVADIEGIN